MPLAANLEQMIADREMVLGIYLEMTKRMAAVENPSIYLRDLMSRNGASIAECEQKLTTMREELARSREISR